MVYEKDLPDGYAEIKHLESPKTGFWFDLMVLFPEVALMLVGFCHVKLSCWEVLMSFPIFLVSVYPYFTLHEMLHGLVYRITTGKKVKIGFTKFGAYCAMPDLFVYRRIAVACTAAPLVVYVLILVPLVVYCIMKESWIFLPVSLVLMLHVFGCRSDMIFLKEIHKVKDKKLLVKDNGTEQYFYLPIEY